MKTHIHTRLFKDVTLDEMSLIGKYEGWSDAYVKMIFDMRSECLDLESQGWCETCFVEQFGKGWPIFDAMKRRQG